MLIYSLKKILRMVCTVFFVISVVFIFSRLTGDPTLYLLSDDAPLSARIELREQLGLDRPIMEQYSSYISGLTRGDMGTSFAFQKPVVDLYAEALPKTIQLGIPALIISVMAGVFLGVVSAVKKDSALDRITMVSSVVGYTIPQFVLGIIMIYVFSLKLKLFPSGGYGTIRHLIMPVLVSCFGPLAKVSRLTRSSMLEVINSDFLRAIKAKGASKHALVFRHALRNSLIPVLTIVGMEVGGIIGGSAIIESVFAWPGVGRLITESAIQRDFPVLQYGILISAAAVTITNTLVDLSYAYIDPRIRES
ncbi:MAG: ABC transporter permease [Eubacteriales bacterium]|nr:ABC transporter permease [Eubacteriales bacterium]